MSLTLKPVLKCNLACVGCYEASVLNTGVGPAPDVKAMLETAGKSPDKLAVLHGGEILMLPSDQAEALCAGLKLLGKSITMQTNGTLLTDRWLSLIDRYKIGVGVSINGPGVLNRARSAGTDEATDRMTERVHANMKKLADIGRLSGIIVVLSTHNAGDDEKLGALIEWASNHIGDNLGCDSIRWNPLFGEGELTTHRLKHVYRRLLAATTKSGERQWLPFREWIDNLCGLGLSPCWMKPCDPYHTDAVHAIFGDGSEGNCLRTSPDGTPWQRTDQESLIRQDILFQIPMAEGGCGDCRYWNFCHGGCPAEAVDGDWRNKSRWCEAIKGTYKAIEEGMTGWMPNWRSAADWDHPSPGALAASIEQRRPLIRAFGAMDPSADSASTHRESTVAND